MLTGPGTRTRGSALKDKRAVERPGIAVNEVQRERYLGGDCALLAHAVAARTGWEVVQIIEGPDEDPSVRHVLVRLPDGRLLDAAGLHDDYSGEEPFSAEEWEWDDKARAMSQQPDVLADADALLAEIGWSSRERRLQ